MYLNIFEEFKDLKISDYIFEKGSLVSIYGEPGSGKTIIGIHIALELGDSVYISTKDSTYRARVEKLKGRPNVYFTQANNQIELTSAILNASKLNLKLIIVDTMNYIYKVNRAKKEIELPLMLIQAFVRSGLNRALLLWDTSSNNRVLGELFMRKFSDDVFRITKGEIIGNLRVCKFKILENGVLGCL
ncbi:ATP-binding protein [Stygiolobus caldivivus]|uniref:AAA family ATPase n=1 Tax=Stygiolobus caldivivus TaxID=2824673 RepID=A0A8D5U7I2_9CREN|nr:DNA/RNA helicase domain-containing protein [Stygiolobus caldivivus]BCU70490.1 AAA family ATPase [Stygiolobus caldivivus]